MSKSLKITLGLFAALVIIIVVTKAGIGLLGTTEHQIQVLESAAQSTWILLFRLLVYIGVWFTWKPFLLSRWPTLTQDQLQQSRRPLVVLIVAYEVLFASEFHQGLFQ